MGLFDCPHGNPRPCRTCDLKEAQDRQTEAIREQTAAAERLARQSAEREAEQRRRDAAADAQARQADRAHRERMARDAQEAADRRAEKEAQQRADLAERERMDRQLEEDARRSEREWEQRDREFAEREARAAAEDAAEEAEAADATVANARDAAAAEGRTLTAADERDIREQAIAAVQLRRSQESLARTNAAIAHQHVLNEDRWVVQFAKDEIAAAAAREKAAAEALVQQQRQAAAEAASPFVSPAEKKHRLDVERTRGIRTGVGVLGALLGLWAYSIGGWNLPVLLSIVAATVVWRFTVGKKRMAAGRTRGTAGLVAVLFSPTFVVTFPRLIEEDAVVPGLAMHAAALILGMVSLRWQPTPFTRSLDHEAALAAIRASRVEAAAEPQELPAAIVAAQKKAQQADDAAIDELRAKVARRERLVHDAVEKMRGIRAAQGPAAVASTLGIDVAEVTFDRWVEPLLHDMALAERPSPRESKPGYENQFRAFHWFELTPPSKHGDRTFDEWIAHLGSNNRLPNFQGPVPVYRVGDVGGVRVKCEWPTWSELWVSQVTACLDQDCARVATVKRLSGPLDVVLSPAEARCDQHEFTVHLD